MNERMAELFAKAGISDSISEEFGIEYLAELLLKDCFQYLENEEERLWSLSAKEGDRVFQSNFEICAEKCRDIREGLKDHFGVK